MCAARCVARCVARFVARCAARCVAMCAARCVAMYATRCVAMCAKRGMLCMSPSFAAFLHTCCMPHVCFRLARCAPRSSQSCESPGSISTLRVQRGLSEPALGISVNIYVFCSGVQCPAVHAVVNNMPHSIPVQLHHVDEMVPSPCRALVPCARCFWQCGAVADANRLAPHLHHALLLM
jgi:hypothetical protein